MKNILEATLFLALFSFISLPVRADTAIDLSKPAQSEEEKAAKEQKVLDRLFVALAKAANEKQGRAIESEIWLNWMAQPDAKVRGLVKRAMRARQGYDFSGAKKLLDEVVKLAPDYAEGWNQRGFILFLQEKYDESLSDLEKALELEPRHFGALAGQTQILMSQGRFATGQSILKKAVKIHPFLRERAMIVDTGEVDL